MLLENTSSIRLLLKRFRARPKLPNFLLSLVLLALSVDHHAGGKRRGPQGVLFWRNAYRVDDQCEAWLTRRGDVCCLDPGSMSMVHTDTEAWEPMG